MLQSLLILANLIAALNCQICFPGDPKCTQDKGSINSEEVFAPKDDIGAIKGINKYYVVLMSSKIFSDFIE